MAPLSDYVTGTITLTNGSPNFTGAGTGWLAAAFREGDTILGIEDNPGVTYVIESITDNDAGTLTQPWDGPTGTYEYRMRYLSDGQRVTAQARTLIELLGNGNLQALAGLSGTPQTLPMFTGAGAMVEVPRTDLVSGANYDVQVDELADRDAYDGQPEGFAVLVSDVGDGRAAIYSKLSNTAGDWSGPAYVTGPIGPEPEITVGTVTRGDADVTSTPVTGGYELDFTIPSQVAQGDYSDPASYVTGDIVQDQGSSWVALQATTGNAPPTLPTTSNTYWQLLARRGVDGAGTVTAVAAGQGVSVDATDPTEPVVALDIMGESVKTANYTLVAADYGGTFIADDTDPIEFAFEAAATLGAKWWAVVKNIGAGDLTLNPDGSETIDGEATLVLGQGQSALVTCNGTDLRTVFRGGGSVEQLFFRICPVGFEYAKDSFAPEPPNDGSAGTWVKLTYDDAYNAGVLINESLSGSAPLVLATAEVNAPGSVYHGQTIDLLNTTARFIRAGVTADVAQNDQMQQIVANILGLWRGNTGTAPTGAFTEASGTNTRPNTGGGAGVDLTFDSANSPDARAGNETRSKNISRVFYKKVAA